MNPSVVFGEAGADLVGSRDPISGEVYFPARALAADGSLRPCAPVTLAREGLLSTWTTFAGGAYGQVDLPDGVRVQTRLSGAEHEIGARYALDAFRDGDILSWSFRRV